MVKIRDRLDEMAQEERLRLRASLNRIPKVTKTGVRRAVRGHPVALALGAAAVAAGTVAVVTVLAKRKAHAPQRLVEVRDKRATSPTTKRILRMAWKLAALLAFGNQRQQVSYAPLDRVPRPRRSPWSGHGTNGANHGKTADSGARGAPAQTGASGGIVDGVSAHGGVTPVGIRPPAPGERRGDLPPPMP